MRSQICLASGELVALEGLVLAEQAEDCAGAEHDFAGVIDHGGSISMDALLCVCATVCVCVCVCVFSLLFASSPLE